MIFGVVFERIPGAHDDERRTLSPVFNMDLDGFREARQLKLAHLKKDAVLGRHWHHYAELFTVHDGGALFSLQSQGGQQDNYILTPGWRLLIPAYTWHEAKVKGGTLLIGLTEERYISPEHNDHKP